MKSQLIAAIAGAALAIIGVAAGAHYVSTLEGVPATSAPVLAAWSPQSLVTLQSAITATANGSAIQMAGAESAVFQVKGITTATITWEATVDGTNWVAVAVADLNSATRARATTATADGLYLFDQAGAVSQIRARISAYTSGSITVTGRPY